MRSPEQFRFKKSTHLAGAIYDSDKRHLTLIFHNGQPYTYIDVPQSIYRTLTMRSSPGSYFHGSIKSHYKLLAPTSDPDK